MCFICKRIEMIKNGENRFFVKELETGYVVIGDHQHFKGYTLFLCKEHKSELFELNDTFKQKYFEEMTLVAKAVHTAFGAEKMNSAFSRRSRESRWFAGLICLSR